MEALDFNAPIEPVPITHDLAFAANFPCAEFAELQSEGILVVGSTYDRRLLWHTVTLLRWERKWQIFAT